MKTAFLLVACIHLAGWLFLLFLSIKNKVPMFGSSSSCCIPPPPPPVPREIDKPVEQVTPEPCSNPPTAPSSS